MQYIFGGLFLLGCLGYLMADQLKEKVSETGAEVASKSISDPELVKRTEELTMLIINDVLEDKKVLSQVQSFLAMLFRQPYTQKLLVGLVIDVLKDEKTMDQVNISSSAQPSFSVIVLPILSSSLPDISHFSLKYPMM